MNPQASPIVKLFVPSTEPVAESTRAQGQRPAKQGWWAKMVGVGDGHEARTWTSLCGPTFVGMKDNRIYFSESSTHKTRALEQGNVV